MPSKKLTVAETINQLMEKYQINPFRLSKDIKLGYTTVRFLINGKSCLSVTAAARLAKYFGQDITFWLNIQRDQDIQKAKNDKKLIKALQGIQKVQMPKAKPQGKTAKLNTLAEKRKVAAKVPGAKPAKKAVKKVTKKR